MPDTEDSWFDQYNGRIAPGSEIEARHVDQTPKKPYDPEEDSAASDEDPELAERRPIVDSRENKQSRFVRALKLGSLAITGVIVTGMAAGAAHGYHKNGNVNSAIEGLMLPFATGARIIDSFQDKPNKSDVKALGATTISESPSPSISKKPSKSPTPTPSPTPSPSKSKNRTPESCIADMPIGYKVGRSIGVAVNAEGAYMTKENVSVPETFEKLRQYDIGNIVVIGNVTKDNKETISKFADGKTLNDPSFVISDPEGINMNHPLGNGNKTAVIRKELTGKALEEHYKALKDTGINMAFVRVGDTVTPSVMPSATPTPSAAPKPSASAKPSPSALPKPSESPSQQSVDAIKEHIAAAKKAGIEPVVVYNPSVESMSKTGEKTKKLFTASLLRATQLVSGPVPSSAEKQDTSNKAEAFDKTIYNKLKKYGINTFITDDLGSAVDEDGKPIPLVESVVDVLALGGTPYFATDANNSKEPLTLEARLKSIVDSGEKAVKSGEISKKTLNHLVEEQLEAQGRLDDACRIADREAGELQINR